MVLDGHLAYDLIRFSSLCLYSWIYECYLCSMRPHCFCLYCFGSHCFPRSSGHRIRDFLFPTCLHFGHCMIDLCPGHQGTPTLVRSRSFFQTLFGTSVSWTPPGSHVLRACGVRAVCFVCCCLCWFGACVCVCVCALVCQYARLRSLNWQHRVCPAGWSNNRARGRGGSLPFFVTLNQNIVLSMH